MTALDAQVHATGLIAYKAVVDHAIENGLQPPLSIDLTTGGVYIWISGNATKWVDSIHVDGEDILPGLMAGREIVHVDGRLPLLGVKVQLRFARTAIPVTVLRAVTG